VFTRWIESLRHRFFGERLVLRVERDGPRMLQTTPLTVPEPGSSAALLEGIRRDSVTLGNGRLDLYCGHLDAGEDTLAWEILVDAAETQRASREIWTRLVAVADAMGLDEQTYPHDDHVRRAVRHLTL
jgi:hypothetical protein